jgi:hypothetical protein
MIDPYVFLKDFSEEKKNELEYSCSHAAKYQSPESLSEALSFVTKLSDGRGPLSTITAPAHPNKRLS